LVEESIFDKRIKKHKGLAGLLNNLENFSKADNSLKGRYVKQGCELALVWAEFKCECCGKETDLNFHHLINRSCRAFVDNKKYFVQRHYFFNIAILCLDCHKKVHNFDGQMLMASIGDKKLSEAKRRFKVGVIKGALKEN